MSVRGVRQRVTALLRGSLVSALDWPYPRHCYHCDRLIRSISGHVLCRRCFGDLSASRIAGPVCRVCGLPLAAGTEPGVLCMACSAEPRHFDRARALFPYAAPTVAVIRHFKFRGDFFLGPRFLRGSLELGWLPPDIERPDVVVPVPLHRRRRRERGYDQALLLAKVVAWHLGCTLRRAALVRTRYTAQQALLPVGRRRDNVRGAFAVREPDEVVGRRVLLVDDVMTTGVTAGECARVLKRAGVGRVTVLTLARAVS